jgi:hypothetical protein
MRENIFGVVGLTVQMILLKTIKYLIFWRSGHTYLEREIKKNK